MGIRLALVTSSSLIHRCALRKKKPPRISPRGGASRGTAVSCCMYIEHVPQYLRPQLFIRSSSLILQRKRGFAPYQLVQLVRLLPRICIPQGPLTTNPPPRSASSQKQRKPEQDHPLHHGSSYGKALGPTLKCVMRPHPLQTCPRRT